MPAADPPRRATDVAAAVADGRTSARAEVDAALARADALQATTNAFTDLLGERARAAADALDARLAAGEAAPPLAGVPIAVKANLAVAGVRTSAGAAILRDYVPPETATVVARLEAAGAIPIAMANLDAFGMGSSSEASVHGPVRNPVDPARVAGGSSGGSAAAVAGGAVPLAVGTDTGGSVRQPAAFTGVLGVKPTYGTLSRSGVIAYASSLDQVGLLAHDANDLAVALDAMVGRDPRDATSLDVPAVFARDLRTSPAADAGAGDAPLAGLRVGRVVETFGEGNAAEVEAATAATLARLEALGAEVRDVAVPAAPAALAAYYLIASAEASSNLARYDGTIAGVRVGEDGDGQVAVTTASRGAGFGREVRRRILMGTFALSAGHVDAWYARALQVRRKVSDDLTAAFGHVDLLATPTAPGVAYPLGARVDDPLAMYLGDADTVLANLAGLGAISVPADVPGGALPVGLQLLAPPLGDGRLLQVAAALQRA